MPARSEHGENGPASVPESATRWPRPDELGLNLSVELISLPCGQDEEYGWQVWHGMIHAGWDWQHDEQDTAVALDALGYDGHRPVFDPDAGSQRLIVGQLSRRVLPLGEEAVCQGHRQPVASGPALWEAGDALSAELEEITATCGNDRLFSSDVCELLGAESFDRVVVLESIELLPAVRGYGVGAWASATSICALSHGVATLLVTKAAPLHREDFIGDPDRRDLTPDEDGAWRAAQTSISAHWRRTLGLRPLPQNPQVLIGSGHIDPGGLIADACHWHT